VSPELFERQHRLFAKAELYNLATDIGETTDLADTHPDIVAALREEALAFDAALQENRREQVWLEPAAVPSVKPAL